MYDFDKFLAFCQQLNSSYKFTDEEIQFLRGEFEDLKTFIEELGKQQGDTKTVDFEIVLQDEIFYYKNNWYVKINKKEGRIFHRQRAPTFGDLTEVQINYSLYLQQVNPMRSDKEDRPARKKQKSVGGFNPMKGAYQPTPSYRDSPKGGFNPLNVGYSGNALVEGEMPYPPKPPKGGTGESARPAPASNE